MKAQVMIPNGWRRLRSNEQIREKDRYLEDRLWILTDVGGEGYTPKKTGCGPYIRRKSPQPRRKEP